MLISTFPIHINLKKKNKMPPKLYPKNRPSAKLTSKSFPPQVLQPNLQQTNSSSSGLDQEVEDKFELELCWCVQQLELSFQSGKLSEKYLKSTQKTLNMLKSNTVPFIQKRQIMRNTFGDYRDKMFQEQKKHSKAVLSVKLSTPKIKNHKSIFVRKSNSTKNNLQQIVNDSNIHTNHVHNEQNISQASTIKLSSLFNKNAANNPFVFNFKHVD